MKSYIFILKQAEYRHLFHGFISKYRTVKARIQI